MGRDDAELKREKRNEVNRKRIQETKDGMMRARWDETSYSTFGTTILLDLVLLPHSFFFLANLANLFLFLLFVFPHATISPSPLLVPCITPPALQNTAQGLPSPMGTDTPSEGNTNWAQAPPHSPPLATHKLPTHQDDHPHPHGICWKNSM